MMRPRPIGPLALGLLAACASAPEPAPPPVARAAAPASKPPAPSTPCGAASSRRSLAATRFAEGKTHRALSLLDDADKTCPESAFGSWELRVAALAEIGSSDEALALAGVIDAAADAPPRAKQAAAAARALVAERRSTPQPDGEALADAGMAALAAGKPVDAQRLFDRAIADLEARTHATLGWYLLDDPEDNVVTVVSSPDGRFMAARMRGDVIVADRSTARRRLMLTSSGDREDMVFSPDGKHLTLPHDNHVIGVADVATGAERTFEPRPSARPFFSHDSATMGVVLDANIELFDVATGRLKQTIPREDRDEVPVAFADGDDAILAWSTRYGVIEGGRERLLPPGENWGNYRSDPTVAQHLSLRRTPLAQGAVATSRVLVDVRCRETCATPWARGGACTSISSKRLSADGRRAVVTTSAVASCGAVAVVETRAFDTRTFAVVPPDPAVEDVPVRFPVLGALSEERLAGAVVSSPGTLTVTTADGRTRTVRTAAASGAPAAGRPEDSPDLAIQSGGLFVRRRGDGPLLGRIVLVAGKDAAFVTGANGDVELLGADAGEVALCIVRPWVLPGTVCRERLEKPGMLASWLSP
jgi:hypothetical protein